MKGFAGFAPGKQPYTPLPNQFFSELLPDIDHLGELKVTLHVFWLLAQKKGPRQCVSQEELAADRRLLRGLITTATASGSLPEDALRDALERAVARGTLLGVAVGEGVARQNWYFVNSEKGRLAVNDLLAGKWTPTGGEPGEAVHVQEQLPNVFVLYEQNIGPLTPMLVEELMEAERTYPADWIEDAVRRAVIANVRKWIYVRAILERWSAEGKTDETPGRRDEADWQRFLESKYADYFER